MIDSPIQIIKFGGASLKDIQSLFKAGTYISQIYPFRRNMVVVVSAMRGVTDQLLDTIDAIHVIDSKHHACNKDDKVNRSHGNQDNLDLFRREQDAIVSSGEQVSAGLMAVVLQKHNVPARSLLGWQIPIYTKYCHKNECEEVVSVGTSTILSCLKEGLVPIVAGFQGISITNAKRQITTLGRGGSDITAVALAKALGTQCCDLYKDVDSIYTADPKIVKRAKPIPKMAYETVLQMTHLGMKIIDPRAVKMAMDNKIALRIFSLEKSTKNTNNTVIVHSFQSDTSDSVGAALVIPHTFRKSWMHGNAVDDKCPIFVVGADSLSTITLADALNLLKARGIQVYAKSFSDSGSGREKQIYGSHNVGFWVQTDKMQEAACLLHTAYGLDG